MDNTDRAMVIVMTLVLAAFVGAICLMVYVGVEHSEMDEFNAKGGDIYYRNELGNESVWHLQKVKERVREHGGEYVIEKRDTYTYTTIMSNGYPMSHTAVRWVEITSIPKDNVIKFVVNQ